MAIQDDLMRGFQALGRSTTESDDSETSGASSALADSLQRLGRIQSMDRSAIPSGLGNILGDGFLNRLTTLLQQNVTNGSATSSSPPSDPTRRT